MVASIIDGTLGGESEVRRWYHEGKTYVWMAQEYQRKYELSVSPSIFSYRRTTRGWERRQRTRDDLIPWEINDEHRWHRHFGMLKLEIQSRRHGLGTLRESDVRDLLAFREQLKAENAVVQYNSHTEEGFSFVPREPGDLDFVRMPDQAAWFSRRRHRPGVAM